jgi:hypothetical protein
MHANGILNREGTVTDHRRERRSERRVHLSEAAVLLGVSKDAVRMRAKCGTLRSEKGEDGRVYVWVNDNPDDDPNTVHPETQVEARRELIDELRDRVRSLEEANRENRRIIAALTQRIPELEAPASPEARESPETLEETQRTERPDLMPQALRRAHRGRGGVGCSVGELARAHPLGGCGDTRRGPCLRDRDLHLWGDPTPVSPKAVEACRRAS